MQDALRVFIVFNRGKQLLASLEFQRLPAQSALVVLALELVDDQRSEVGDTLFYRFLIQDLCNGGGQQSLHLQIHSLLVEFVILPIAIKIDGPLKN